MTMFQCPSDILITSCGLFLFTARWSTWPGNHVAEFVGSCIPIHATWGLPDPKASYPSGLSLPLCQPLMPCPSRGSLPLHGLWWMTCELHYTPLLWRRGSMYQLWKSPLISSAPWSSDQTSCLSLQYMSYTSRQLSHTWDQVISKSHAPSSCKQSRRRDQDVRRTSKCCH